METDQVSREQDEEKNKMKVKHEEEKDTQTQTKEAEEALLQKRLEQQSKTLKAIHEDGRLKRQTDVTL
jgi:hypothetical protein